MVTESGIKFLAQLGIDVDTLTARKNKSSGRVLCRACLDWSERRPHLAGALGAALCARCLDKGWIRRVDGTRAVSVTPKGRQIFREQFGAHLA
jgi:hypothetical protein